MKVVLGSAEQVGIQQQADIGLGQFRRRTAVMMI
jgi:hypothetical protein